MAASTKASKRMLSSCFSVCRHHIKKRKMYTDSISTTNWQGVIGLEIHSQSLVNSKLFSAAGTRFGAPVNSQVSHFDSSLPGTLPVINRGCVEAAVVAALALNCHINMVSKFDRKHYFYADLPAGYQITQHRQPIAVNGYLKYTSLQSAKGNQRPVKKMAKILQIQLEQDSGKSLHDDELRRSLIDLNRAGVGLMEIVTAPDFSTGTEAAAFIKELLLILQTIKVCDGKMSEGSLRVDANVSVHHPGQPLGVRTEVKNLNSITGVTKAIDFEIKRQISELEKGNEIFNETKSFDYVTGKTVTMRDKERLQDYRFMPEPNLLPLRLYTNDTLPTGLSDDQIVNVDKLRDSLPLLPAQKRQAVQDKYGLSYNQAQFLVGEEGLLEYFTDVVEETNRDPLLTYNLLANQVLMYLNREDISIHNSPVCSKRLKELVVLLSHKTISLNTAKKVLEVMFEGDTRLPPDIVEHHNWKQITDPDKIEEYCLDAITKNHKLVSLYKGGKKKVFQNLVGQVHKMAYGRAEPNLVNEILKKKLDQM